jgi:hypothetical protein
MGFNAVAPSASVFTSLLTGNCLTTHSLFHLTKSKADGHLTLSSYSSHCRLMTDEVTHQLAHFTPPYTPLLIPHAATARVATKTPLPIFPLVLRNVSSGLLPSNGLCVHVGACLRPLPSNGRCLQSLLSKGSTGYNTIIRRYKV